MRRSKQPQKVKRGKLDPVTQEIYDLLHGEESVVVVTSKYKEMQLTVQAGEVTPPPVPPVTPPPKAPKSEEPDLELFLSMVSGALAVL